MRSAARLAAAALLAGGGTLAAAGEGRMDEALALVEAHHPELERRRAEHRAVAEAPAWSADVDLSVSRGRTEFGASDTGRAELSVTIPLVGGGREAEAAAAQRELAQARAGVREAFLDAVGELRALAAEREAAAEHRSVLEDRLAYHREAVEAGEAEPDALWGEVERLQAAEHDYRRADTALDAELEATARRFGGEAWKRLRDLLAAIVS